MFLLVGHWDGMGWNGIGWDGMMGLRPLGRMVLDVPGNPAQTSYCTAVTHKPK